MTSDRRSQLGRLALVLLGSVVACLSTSAAGAGTTAGPAAVEVGWWTRLPTESAPAGGFAVGSAPDGPTSVAAVRLDLESGVRSATLDVSEAGGTLQGLAALRVCVTTTPWRAAAGGPMTDAPTADCGGHAVSLVSRGSGAWQADVSTLTTGRTGVVSLMVLPDPDQGVPGVYDVQFRAPRLTAAVAPGSAPVAEPAPLDLEPAPAEFAPPPPAAFFAPLAPSDTAPPVIGGPTPSPPPAAAPLDVAVAPAPARRDRGPSRWRWQLWLQLVALAAAVGAAAGGLRWSTASGPLRRLVPQRHPLPP